MSAEPQTQPWDPRAAVGQRFSVSVVVGAEAETLSRVQPERDQTGSVLLDVG